MKMYKLIFLLLILFSCNADNNKNKVHNIEIYYDYNIRIIDSCEYIICDGDNRTLTHKGNCKNCKLNK